MHLKYCGVVKRRATGTWQHHLGRRLTRPIVRNLPIKNEDLLAQMEQLGSVFTEPGYWVPDG
jgi:hypothetical protein